MENIKSIFCFVAAGLCEIGGGYLIWLFLREGRGIWFGIAGVIILFLFGAILTLQPASFGRVYAAYGGVFIALSILWGWKVDKVTPDGLDLLGGAITLIGVGIIMYAPRS
jgi:small multidrug resistance family-3 protein